MSDLPQDLNFRFSGRAADLLAAMYAPRDPPLSPALSGPPAIPAAPPNPPTGCAPCPPGDLTVGHVTFANPSPKRYPLDPDHRAPGLRRREALQPRAPGHRPPRLREDPKLALHAVAALFGEGGMDTAQACKILGLPPAKPGEPPIRVEAIDWRLRRRHAGKPDWLAAYDAYTLGHEPLREFQKQRCAICGKHHIKARGLRVHRDAAGRVLGLLCIYCLRDADTPPPCWHRSDKWVAARHTYLDAPPGARFRTLHDRATPDPAALPAPAFPKVEDYCVSRGLLKTLWGLQYPPDGAHEPGTRYFSLKIPLTFVQLSGKRLVTLKRWPEGGGMVQITDLGRQLLANLRIR